MRTIYNCLLPVFVICLCAFSASSQVQWIANVPFEHTAFASLYNMIEDEKPLVIALGNMHTQASEDLLTSGTLQKLSAEHDAGAYGDRFSTKDLRVAFVDVQVFPEDQALRDTKGIQFIHLNEGDESLNKAGWKDFYSISATRLFLVTPDHLVRPLISKTAADIYKEVQFWNTKVRPSASPDVRLIDALVIEGNKAQIRVQNFSTESIQGVEIQVLKDGQEIAVANYTGSIASLEDAVIAVELPGGANSHLTILAKAAGDVNDLNNRWSGPLRSTGDASMVAATFAK